MRRSLIALVITVVLSSCSSSKKVDTKSDEQRQEQLRQQKDCADPQWKAAHLGIWYNVCRDNRSL